MAFNQQTHFQLQIEPKKTQRKVVPLIMIIDDDAELLEELKDALSTNYQVETLSNSAQAFDMVYELKPDVIILDMKMSPKTGLQLGNEFRNFEGTKYIPIIVITGVFIEKEHTLMMKLFGMRRIIIKPFDHNQLLEEIESALKDSKPRWS